MSSLPITLAEDSGDQMLDGIGETALIARYVLAADVRDWSRNNLHAEVRGKGVEFENSEPFGKVLSLPPNDRAGIALPARILSGVDSMTVCGWVYLRKQIPNARLFDFGTNAENCFYAIPADGGGRGFKATLVVNGSRFATSDSVAIAPKQWVHFAVVIDISDQTLTTYVNGKRAGQAKNVEFGASTIVSRETPSSNYGYLGCSSKLQESSLDAMLHDFRVYRTALSSEEVARIRNLALDAEVSPASGNEEKFSENSQKISPFLADLVAVPGIQVETPLGTLPKLPRFLSARFKEADQNRKVRVIWPAPTDNQSVRKLGTHTITGRIVGTDIKPIATVSVVPVTDESGPIRDVEAFPLNRVMLMPDTQGRDTAFMRNRDKFLVALAATNPDDFLYTFRNAFGQKQPEGATPLAGWDSQETKVRGQTTGHYLTAIAQSYAGSAHDSELQAEFAKKMTYLVDTLHDLAQLSGKPVVVGGEHQPDPAKVPPGPGKKAYDSDLSVDGIRNDYWNWGRGYISAYPPDQFIMLEQGATYGGTASQVWAPYYVLHKIIAGLLDCYEIGGNQKALVVAEGAGDWIYERLRRVPPETRVKMWGTYIAGEYGGMNEVMARLHRISGKERYLKTAQLFDNDKFFFGGVGRAQGLARNVDVVRGRHANQHIPQVTGALEVYSRTGSLEYYQVASNFWDLVTQDYMFAIGGVAGARNPNNAECFTAQPASLYKNGFSAGGQNETCATYNLLKLSRKLFMYDEAAKYMDYYERALYNHILASVDRDNPGNTYHVALNPGSEKGFGNADMRSFTCCNCTALESHTKLQDSIFFKSKDNETLYVNLYIPSKLDWRERGIVVEQRTSFPYEESSEIMFRGSGRFDLRLRIPGWAKRGFTVSINDKPQNIEGEPGSYVSVNRDWNDGDKVVLKIPLGFHLNRIMDQPNIAAIFYGPVLLAAEEPKPRNEWRKIELNHSILRDPPIKASKTLRFEIDGINFKPFFDIYKRHSVYLDVELE